MATKRKGLSKTVRFEVFKRDRFTCQYCGKQAPNVVLQADHIHPVAEGGTDELLNLITSCEDCNSGKGARTLSDDSAVSKQRAQLEALAERREQIDMMLEWSRELGNQREYELDAVVERIEERLRCGLTDTGRTKVKGWLRKHSLVDLLDAVEISADQYLDPDPAKWSSEKFERAFSAIPGIVRVRSLPKDEQGLLYVRGIVRNRFNRCDEQQAIELLRGASAGGHSIERLKEIARGASSWSKWVTSMYELVEE